MSTHTKIKPEDLPEIGQPSQLMTSAPKSAFEVETEYLCLKADESQETRASLGDVVVFCVVGQLRAEVDDASHDLNANRLVHVGAGSRLHLYPQEDSVVVITTFTPKRDHRHLLAALLDRTAQGNIDVEEASEESFPASDSPGFNPGAST